MTFTAIRQFLSRASLTAAAVIFAIPSLAVEGTPPTRNSISFHTQDADARRAGGPADQLLQRARARGQVRVIVGLRTTMRMEHTLSPQEIDRQRASLHAIQNRIIARALGTTSAATIERFDFIPYMSVFVTAAELAKLIEDPDVVSIYEDVPQRPMLADSTKIIHATDLWAKGIDGTDQVVAVLDTGAQTTHPMLTGKVVSQACYSTANAAANIASLCKNGATASVGANSGVNCPVSIEGCDHGTHVASIAAGNSNKLDGVARGANLIIIKIFSRLDNAADCSPSPAPCLSAFSTDVIKGLRRVLALQPQYKIAAVNLSLGGGLFDVACDASNQPYATAFNNVRAAGIAPIVASGNDGNTGKISRPGCFSSAIAVGNTQKDDLVADSSNHNALVKLLAPGTDIKAAVPGNKYDVKTGTSMAAPHVAGAFALLKDAKPTATVDEMLAALSCTGKFVDQRYDSLFGFHDLSPARPRIDVLGAYYHLLKPPGATRTWDFSNSKQALDWSPLRGDWEVSGGSYSQTPIVSNDWGMSLVDNCDGSLQVTATMTRVDPSPYSTTNGFHYNAGVMLKTVVDYDANERAGYFFAYNVCRTNKISNLCTDDPKDPIGQGAIYRLESTQSGTLLCYKQVPVKKDAPNTVKVISQGSSHSLYVNGKLVCTVTDATYTVGPVILATFVPDAAGHAFSVDSVTVKSLDTAAPSPPDVMDPGAIAKAASPGMTPQGSRAVSTSIARAN